MIVYEFIYNPFYHESVAGTISVHVTRKGAEIALAWHQHEAYLEYLQKIKELKENKISIDNMKFGDSEYWGIRETKLEL
jgi:hypothetical protein